ncbi:MAG: TIM barrel protein, partial [Oscillospiraceae bacterium]
MHVGISTACLFPMPTEYALACILALDTTTVEVFLNSPSEAEIAFVRQLRHQADDAGARIVALHPYSSEWEGASFFGQYERRFDDCAEEYKRLFQTCNELGADIMAFHGAHRFLPIDVNFYCERFGRLSEIAASFGVRLCHENVARFW